LFQPIELKHFVMFEHVHTHGPHPSFGPLTTSELTNTTAAFRNINILHAERFDTDGVERKLA
jgi:hypothetical protein